MTCAGNNLNMALSPDQCNHKCGDRMDGECLGNDPAFGEESNALCVTREVCRELRVG